MGRIYVVGTADTKGDELAYLAAQVRSAGASVAVVDVGTRPATLTADFASAEIASHGRAADISSSDRGTVVAAMGEAFAAFVSTREDVSAIVGIGGGGGTSIITAGMRRLPYGVPKLMVSTLASGDTSAFVGISDLMMMPAIADIAGLNRISRMVLDRAAAAVAAMAATPLPAASARPAVGLTMFGVTTAAVTAIMGELADDFDCIPFHATGTGGRALEALVDAGLIEGVLDITTTEIADFIVGGVLPAGPDRLDCIARSRVPYVGSLGACDMVNFWAPETVPPAFADRLFHRHNANITLMRTTPAECDAIAKFIAGKLNQCEGEVRILIPEGGVSALDQPDGAFWDPAADSALFATLADSVHWTSRRQLIRLPLHINDPAFARAAAQIFRDIST